MIYSEDEFPLENKFDVIIPVTCTLYDGKLRIDAYDSVKNVAEEFVNRFSDDVFSDSALEWLNSRLKPMCEEWGYVFDEQRFLYKWKYAFCADGQTRLNMDAVLPSTRIVTEDESLEKQVEMHINGCTGDFDEYDYTAFGTVIDGKIISLCSENSHYLADDQTEVGIETAEEYRKHGYAASNLAAISAHLLDNGCGQVWYKCDRYNVASRKTAEKAGLRLVGKNYYYVAYLK